MHSAKFELVKGYFDKKLWTLKMVHSAVSKWITEEEFKEITNEDYIN